MSYPSCTFDHIFMKPAKRATKKVAKAPAAAKNITGVDLEYVNEVIDDAVSTMMAMRALIGILVEKLEDRDDAR